MKQKFIALAKEGKYFETNPKANLFIFTEDGNAFAETDRHEAISHAARLGSQAHVITRSDVENEVETEEDQSSITEDEKEDFEEQINESLLKVVSDATIEIKTTDSPEEPAGSEIAEPAPNASVAKTNSKPKGK